MTMEPWSAQWPWQNPNDPQETTVIKLITKHWHFFNFNTILQALIIIISCGCQFLIYWLPALLYRNSQSHIPSKPSMTLGHCYQIKIDQLMRSNPCCMAVSSKTKTRPVGRWFQTVSSHFGSRASTNQSCWFLRLSVTAQKNGESDK